jgi:hypothetical protein
MVSCKASWEMGDGARDTHFRSNEKRGPSPEGTSRLYELDALTDVKRMCISFAKHRAQSPWKWLRKHILPCRKVKNGVEIFKKIFQPSVSASGSPNLRPWTSPGVLRFKRPSSKGQTSWYKTIITNQIDHIFTPRLSAVR